jgi:cytochrome b pre-mRNA-processing protein 3
MPKREKGAFQKSPAQILYFQIVAHARQPIFYQSFGVPDTVVGRFDMILLFVALVVRRLRGDAPSEDARTLADGLFDVLFADMDRSLREMGISDIRVGKKVKVMAQAFYGRSTAYDAALDGREPLGDALSRNLYASAEADKAVIKNMAAYIQRAMVGLEGHTLKRLIAGGPGFIPPTQGDVDPGGEEI